MAVCQTLSWEPEDSLVVGSALLVMAIGQDTGRELGVHSKGSIDEAAECALDSEGMLVDHIHMVGEHTGLVGEAHAYSQESSLVLS